MRSLWGDELALLCVFLSKHGGLTHGHRAPEGDENKAWSEPNDTEGSGDRQDTGSEAQLNENNDGLDPVLNRSRAILAICLMTMVLQTRRIARL